jgi:3-oxoacyl-[acyl-carrier-protein] synthase II
VPRTALITGLSMITPLGETEETWSGLLAGKFITNHARAVGGPDRIHSMAVDVARRALANAKWSGRADGRTALVVGTSKGAVESCLLPPLPCTQGRGLGRGASDAGQQSAHVAASRSEPLSLTLSPEYREEGIGLASIAARICESFPLLDGPTLTISAACASGLHALIRGAMMIRSGEADRVLVVAAEASVHPLFLASFNRLGVLPREGCGCRPFDQHRGGFLMSDAAAAVCLEPVESNLTGGAWAKIERFALFGDATHMTAGDPEGRTLRRALRDVGNGRDVDLIHAHGTGTQINDPLELSAFDDECAHDEHPPIVFSHKGALGHSLGAAGLVTTVLNCLMHARGVVPPNIRTQSPLPTRNLILSQDSIERPIRRSIAVASGFGGATAAVSFVSP